VRQTQGAVSGSRDNSPGCIDWIPSRVGDTR
jgi:hypothetical protein